MKNCITTLLILMATINFVSAATIVVNNNQDLSELDGNCDLRDALNSASINIAIDGCIAGENNVIDQIIVLVDGPIQLESTLPVFGSVLIATSFGADPIEIIAAAGERIMRVTPDSLNDNDFAMTNFKLTQGQAGIDTDGGAIYFSGTSSALGNIELTNMIFEGNSANQGGALYFNETNADSLTIAESQFINNSAESSSGAVGGFRVAKPASVDGIEINNNLFQDNTSAGSAGALFIRNEGTDTINISDNQFINNSAADNIGAVGVGAIVDDQDFHLERNLFLFNNAGSDAGALQVSFGSIVYVRESLFAFNQAARGGGITSTFDDALLRLSNSTLVHNGATTAGDNLYIFGNGRIIPTKNIIAYPQNGDNCSGALGTTPTASSNNNISDDSTCELLNSLSQTQITDPLLTGFSNDLDYYPGFAPSVNSPALDGTESCGQNDVMGRTRPLDGDGDGMAFCDIGAIESPANTDVIWADSFGL